MSKKYKGLRVCDRCNEVMLFLRQFVVRDNRYIMDIGVGRHVV